MFRRWILLGLSGTIIYTAVSSAVSSAGWSMEPLELTVVVSNLRNAKGQVRVALWAGPEGFTDADAAVLETGQPAAEGRVRFVFSGLAPGRYAVASFHDENGNGKFDRTWIGLPDEGLGFSNGAWISLGPPPSRTPRWTSMANPGRSRFRCGIEGQRRNVLPELPACINLAARFGDLIPMSQFH